MSKRCANLVFMFTFLLKLRRTQPTTGTNGTIRVLKVWTNPEFTSLTRAHGCLCRLTVIAPNLLSSRAADATPYVLRNCVIATDSGRFPQTCCGYSHFARTKSTCLRHASAPNDRCLQVPCECFCRTERCPGAEVEMSEIHPSRLSTKQSA